MRDTETLRRIRALARPALVREKVLATVVRLLETLTRVGNEEYARTTARSA